MLVVVLPVDSLVGFTGDRAGDLPTIPGLHDFSVLRRHFSSLDLRPSCLFAVLLLVLCGVCLLGCRLANPPPSGLLLLRCAGTSM